MSASRVIGIPSHGKIVGAFYVKVKPIDSGLKDARHKSNDETIS